MWPVAGRADDRSVAGKQAGAVVSRQSESPVVSLILSIAETWD